MTMMSSIFGNDLFDDWMDLPGYKKEDITTQLKDGYMTITAKKDTGKADKDKDDNYILRERYTGP